MDWKLKFDLINLKGIKIFFLAVGAFMAGVTSATVTPKKYHQILDKIEGLYREEILQVTGRSLFLYRSLGEGNFLVMDSAQQHPMRETSDVTITGLLAAHEHITPDAFALMICHEFGHHLGGLPRQPQRLVAWSSVEGQADYWGVRVCLRKYLEETSAVDSGGILPVALAERCEEKFQDERERDICFRSLKAALAMGRYLGRNSGSRPGVSWQTPETEVATRTKIKYGSPQCRLDTFIQAALGEDRPSCWYQPTPSL